MTKEQRVLEICKRRGLKIEPAGKAWRIHGFDVDITVARIEDADPDELGPGASLTPHKRRAS